MKRTTKTSLLFVGTTAVVIAILFMLMGCEGNSKLYYPDTLVRYDTAHFKVFNDTVAQHRVSKSYYKKTRTGVWSRLD